jgi:hypothetical protein
VTSGSSSLLTILDKYIKGFSMSITLGNGITLGAGMTLGSGTPAPVLKLNLDAAGYSSGPWVDTVASRSFTLYNGVTYSTDGGGSLDFDPTSGQYAECTSSLADLSTWTIVAWHYYAGTNTGIDPGAAGACIITEGYPGVTGNINYSLGNDQAELMGTPNDLYSGFFNGAWRTTPAGHTLTAGNWYQIVGTYDGTSIKLYVNNTLVGTTTYSGTPISGQDGIVLMKRWDNDDFWGGKLAIVQVYEGAMDATQVNTNYNTNIGRF